MHPLTDAVEALMREVSTTIVLPRFRQLAASDVHEKSPGETVTIVDSESERRLTEGLLGLLPDSRVLGEEASETKPVPVSELTSGSLWIVDPLDGTGNFAAGEQPFAIMIALAIDGEPEASWILDPVSGRFCTAARSCGASIDGRAVHMALPSAGLSTVAVALHRFTPEQQEQIARRAQGRINLVSMPLCAGDQYPRMVLGGCDASAYVRALPWDHVPGSLIVQEAGGVVARPDGSPYRLDRPGPGLIAAATPQLLELTAEVVFS